jgi:hypothetical protein
VSVNTHTHTHTHTHTQYRTLKKGLELRIKEQAGAIELTAGEGRDVREVREEGGGGLLAKSLSPQKTSRSMEVAKGGDAGDYELDEIDENEVMLGGGGEGSSWEFIVCCE